MKPVSAKIVQVWIVMVNGTVEPFGPRGPVVEESKNKMVIATFEGNETLVNKNGNWILKERAHPAGFWKAHDVKVAKITRCRS